MRFCLVIFTFVITLLGVHSLIIPDELPTLLSVIYSNIPIFKKGTDSRFGWGFRLGRHADFQVLTELGPQKYTQPLANQPDADGTSKRNTVDSLSNELYAQRQHDKKQQQQQQITDTDAEKWLKAWSQNAKNQVKVQPESDLPEGAKPGIAIGEIDAKSVIPDDATLSLRDLYEKSMKIQNTSSREEIGDLAVEKEEITEKI